MTVKTTHRLALGGLCAVMSMGTLTFAPRAASALLLPPVEEPEGGGGGGGGGGGAPGHGTFCQEEYADMADLEWQDAECNGFDGEVSAVFSHAFDVRMEGAAVRDGWLPAGDANPVARILLLLFIAVRFIFPVHQSSRLQKSG